MPEIRLVVWEMPEDAPPEIRGKFSVDIWFQNQRCGNLLLSPQHWEIFKSRLADAEIVLHKVSS